MNKKEYEKLEKSLLEEHGYKKYIQNWHNEDYTLGKSFHRADNQWDDERSGYQLLLNIYDYSIHPEYHDRLPKVKRDLRFLKRKVEKKV